MDTNAFPYDIEVIAIDLMIPWAIAISNEGKLYVTERTGAIWIMENGSFYPEPLIRFGPPFISRGEGGLLGIVLDPDFMTNHYLYVMHSYQDKNKLYNRVVRLLEKNNRATVDKVIIDKLPGASFHNGGRIKIGPDKKMYITTGDAGNAISAQDISSLGGKILRIGLDGSIPADNPFQNSPVYSLGHRDPQGLAWNADGVLYESEHGPVAHDEINIIRPGENYGWPLVQGDEDTNEVQVTKPLIQSGEVTWAPSGIAFVNQGPWSKRLLVAALRGQELLSISLKNTRNEAEGVEAWLVNRFGRLREVIQADDGTIYLTTSNRDGRGNPDRTDDKIIRLRPINTNRSEKLGD